MCHSNRLWLKDGSPSVALDYPVCTAKNCSMFLMLIHWKSLPMLWGLSVGKRTIPMPFQTLLFGIQTRILSKADTCISKKSFQDGIEMISVGEHKTCIISLLVNRRAIHHKAKDCFLHYL
ncbi:hypothetical protein HNY73_004576 [Argiope bruennichi]|uniref:Uncharacterized protein n=1 Tax=Argiope bruennichi TaxID=94029 RepID=A0A8T0FPD6_ARGBR|nr:hypothetical protein HNY73_004576 [Argiope bruennichi]